MKMKMKTASFSGFVAALALSSIRVSAFTGHDPFLQCRHHRAHACLLQAVSSKQEKTEDTKIEKFQVSSSRGSKAIKENGRVNDNKGAWASLKNALYGTFDGVGALGSIIGPKSSESEVEEGYKSIEQTVLKDSGSLSPGQRLMNEYRERSTAYTPVKSDSVENKGNAFNSFKSTLYGGFDAASSVFEGETKDDETRSSFKPLVQSTLSSPEIQAALPDLQSSNVFARKKAENKIKDWDSKERKRQRAIEREEAARKFKESVYQATDATVSVVKVLASTPETVSRAAAGTKVFVKGTVNQAKDTVEKVKGTANLAANSAASFPDKVAATSDGVKSAVKVSVQKTKKAVDGVKAIPSKIKKSIDDTKQSVNSAITTVEEVTTDTKVFLGLEKPIPKPPKKPPPPPPSASELGLKLATKALSTAATGTAKLAWWAGKGTASAAWNLTVSAVQQTSAEGKPVKGTSQMLFNATKAEPNNMDVDKEVEEALLLAQSALDFADTESSPSDDNGEGKNDKNKKNS